MPVRNEANPARPNLETLLDIYTHYHLFPEIVALDDESTDGTVALLEKHRCRIFHTGGQMPTQAQKNNYLMAQASTDWCLQLDADEWMDWGFIRELASWIAPDSKARLPNVVAFKFPRPNQHHVYPDYQYRLFDRRYVVWTGKAHVRLCLKTTMRPVDEPTAQGIRFCQTLDDYPIFHIPRDWAYDAEVQKHWVELENAPDSPLR